MRDLRLGGWKDPAPAQTQEAPPSWEAGVTEREWRSPHGHSGEQWPSQSEALEKAAELGWPCGWGEPKERPSAAGRTSFLPPSPPRFPFLSIACNFIRKIERGFLARKETSPNMRNKSLELAQLGPAPATAVAGVAFPPILLLVQAEASLRPLGWKPRLPPGPWLLHAPPKAAFLLNAVGLCGSMSP